MIKLAGLHGIQDLDLSRNRVLIRVDFDIYLKRGVPVDDTRIQEAIPTIRLAMEAGAKVILATHASPSKPGQSAPSLEPYGQRLAELTGYEVHLPEDCVGDAPKKVIQDLREGQLCLLENLLLHKEEEANSPEFAGQLAELCDIYINDAFGACTKAWSSLHALPRQMHRRACGLQLEKELQALRKLTSPEHPMVALLGGARLSDKLPFIEALLDRVDVLLIGGAIANTFLKAQKKSLQIPRIEEENLALVQSILYRAEKRNVTVLLPTDVVVAQTSNDTAGDVVRIDAIPTGKIAFDIGPETTKAFLSKLDRARTVYWNGPVGVHDSSTFSAGTSTIIKTLGKSDAFTVASGGDTIAALASVNPEIRSEIQHISTAGSAVLDFLAGRKLPGIEALRQ